MIWKKIFEKKRSYTPLLWAVKWWPVGKGRCIWAFNSSNLKNNLSISLSLPLCKTEFFYGSKAPNFWIRLCAYIPFVLRFRVGCNKVDELECGYPGDQAVVVNFGAAKVHRERVGIPRDRVEHDGKREFQRAVGHLVHHVVQIQYVVGKTLVDPPGADVVVPVHGVFRAPDDRRVSHDLIQYSQFLPDVHGQHGVVILGHNDHAAESTWYHKQNTFYLRTFMICCDVSNNKISWENVKKKLFTTRDSVSFEAIEWQNPHGQERM